MEDSFSTWGPTFQEIRAWILPFAKDNWFTLVAAVAEKLANIKKILEIILTIWNPPCIKD
jgi:hypothetical protein